jgi:hypothetical protein
MVQEFGTQIDGIPLGMTKENNREAITAYPIQR